MHLVPGKWTAEIVLQRELKSFCNCLAVGFPKVTMTPQGPQVVVVGPGVLLVSRVLQLIHLLFTGEICMETRNPPSRDEKSINKHKQAASSSLFEQGFWFLHLCTSRNSCHTYRQRYDLCPLPTCKKNNWIHNLSISASVNDVTLQQKLT